MTDLSRRQLLRRTGQASLALAVLGRTDLLRAAAAGAQAGQHGRRDRDGSIDDGQGFGPLVADPAGTLDLPAGFSYRIIAPRAGETMPGSGQQQPGRPDSMGTFARSGGSYLVQNHEQGTTGVSCAQPGVTAYDPTVRGGTTTYELDRHGDVVREFISLAGTYNNCSGGVTPWGTWLTCEETETTAARPHGYVFEVDPVRGGDPRPITQLGRFAHEAAVVDPDRGDVFLTEDASRPNGLLYRYAIASPARRPGDLLASTGVLTAMRARHGDTLVTDLSTIERIGTRLRVEWVPVPDPNPDLAGGGRSVRKQFDYVDYGTGASVTGSGGAITRSKKFEGAWWGDDGRAYIVCSFAHGATDWSAGDHDGQVWSYDPRSQHLTLEVRFARNLDPAGAGADQPDGPDNITYAPDGGLFLAEDGEGVQHLLRVGPEGRTELFARNRVSDSEFTGVVFSPDGSTLFANIQDDALTFAITGPFDER